MLSFEEQASLTAVCATVPLTNKTYIATDFVSALLDTVIDYQQHTTTVRRAIAHFNANQCQAIRTLDDLKRLLNRFPDDRDGNTALALHLWNYKFWRRTSELRGLVAFFDALGIETIEALRHWATHSTFQDDFQGRVKGLGPVVYQWLGMRLGVETVKPDVHIVRFVSGSRTTCLRRRSYLWHRGGGKGARCES